MNELIKETDIENMIYEIRGMQVMLSSDVAKLYQVETKALNQTIKRNIKRFPSSFCFRLTNIEYKNLRSQFVTSSLNDNYGGVRYLPFVLTEEGILMLSGLLKSDIAVKVNIQVIEAFVKMRKYISNELLNNSILLNHENRLLKLEESFDKYNMDIKKNTTFYKNQIYDAYSFFINVLFKGVKEIIIIDNYAGRELLDMIKDIDKKIIIISKNINNVLKEKYEKQYHNVTFIYNDTIHDRYIILDRTKLYHCGMSFKDLGKSTFTITEFDNTEEIEDFISKLNLNGIINNL